MSAQARDFPGTQRFEVRTRLGEGGMGVVYEAFDHERNTVVALKTLRGLEESPNADLVLRFKNEFRSLQDLQHPNLVSLGELIEDSGHWFFTMELLDGVDFLEWVRPGQAADGDHTPTRRSPRALLTPVTTPDGSVGATMAHAPTVPVPVGELPPLREGRLREAMRQLAAGLSALHAAGKVHRDIKPNNILVQRDGRLVLLDFGLVTDATRENWAEEGVVGTTAYMAPEQAASKPVGPEADCYAVGVLLFEALTGQLPFSGSTFKILMSKQREEAPSPRAVDPSVPADLDHLCRQLLEFKPALRPTARDLMARLGGPGHATPLPSERSWSFSQSSLFVGRQEELGELRQAFADTLAGQTATLLIEGESGVGKTALARQFLSSIRALHADAVVLQARCYERESVPFKAFDGIVDALSQYMVSLSDADAAVLLPVNAALLTQVFPVLRRVRVMAKAPRPRHDLLDPQQLRMRVFGAVRELLTRLADRRPLILVVDDFQWADADSLALLGELTRQPEGPGLLLVLIATVRSEDDESPHLDLPARRVRLHALGPLEARQLATLLARRSGADPTLAEAIAADANGHPLFIDELVRHAVSAGAQPAPVHLDAALQGRIAQLDPQERRLLELVAVAGGRLTQEIAARASAMPSVEFDKRLASLRVAHMVMTKGERRSDAVEPYHDRVRRAVLASLGDHTRREHHEQLALALEASGRADPESLATHWRGAGEIGHAAKYAGQAADRAARTLAFDRAAAFYRIALELRSQHGDAEARALLVKLAEALVNAGRGSEAAEVYLAAAASAVGAEELDLKRRAAEQLLRCGHIDEALELYRTIQRALGMPLATTPARAIISLLAQRVRIRLRGLRFTERDESHITRRDLSRIDTGFFVGLGLTTVDTIRGADLLARQLLLALDAGEPYRVARAVALQAAVNAANAGAKGHARTAALVELARAIATRIDQPHALGLATWAAGASAYLEGRFADGQTLNDQALAIYRERCTGVAWEAASAQAFSLWSLYYLGEWAELGHRLPALIKQARDRGDLYDSTNLRTSHTNSWWLAIDEPARAAAEAVEALREWSPSAFHLQHYYELHALSQCDLYTGDGASAYRRVLGRWAQMKSNLLFEVVTVKLEMLYLRARAAIATALQQPPGERRVLLRAAAADARALAKAGMAWSSGLAELVTACGFAAEGRVEIASSRFSEAERTLDSANMRLHAACARRCRGRLLGGDDGARLIAEADAWMREQKIVQPSRIAALYAPLAP